MSQVPEGTPTITSEGRDLAAAVAAAATELGVAPHKVAHKLDMSHFRGENGRPVPRSTVKVIAWVDANAPDEAPAEAPRRERRERPEGERSVDGERRERDGDRRGPRPEGDRGPRRERSDDDRGPRPEGERRERSDGDRGPRPEGERRERSDGDRGPRPERSERGPRPERADRPSGDRPSGDRGPRPERRERRDRDDRPADGAGADAPREGLRGPEAGPTDASEFAQVWFAEALKLMDVEGVVTGTGSSERVHLHVKADKAGRIIGKRGSTLASIRHLLLLAMEARFGALVLDVDVADERPRTEGAGEPRRERRDSREGGGREGGREGGRGGRERRGREDRGDRGGDRGERRGASADETGRHPEEKLQQLAKRAAEKAIETGKTITINLPLNSYDRRIVHLVVQEMVGVTSRSEERDGMKYIQVIPELGSE